MYMIVVVGYTLTLLFIFFFSLGQLDLTRHYLKARKAIGKNHDDDQLVSAFDIYPMVTIQLPVYNELYVIERLIDAVAKFEYASDRLEIQVLDDSTDETVDIIAERVKHWKQQGVDIKHVRRSDRVGYKAGALEYGMGIAKGDFIGIFDADFIPEPNFLKRTMKYFGDPKIGVVQTRWGHINKDYSLLTQLQAFGLDAHFSIEQIGRSQAGSFINFNGTAGVWRKTTIIDAGGWSADTLTEDLDLSYRAQMKGWVFKYLEEVASPAELPIIMPAIKSQQYRWNKGAAETAKKNFRNVLKSPISFSNKVHAFFHLFNSSIFICLLFASILSIPMLIIKNQRPEMNMLFNVLSIFLIGFFSISYFYWTATKRSNPDNTFAYFIKIFPVFLTVSMGLSLHNGLAVLEGLIGRKSPFVRTPKFNINDKDDKWDGNIYIKPTFTFLTLLEGILALYFVFGIGLGIQLGDYGLIIFHVMLAIGFGTVFYYSVKPVVHVVQK